VVTLGPLLLATILGAQEPPPAATSLPVTVSDVWFEPAYLAVHWDQVVALGVTYIKTQFRWRFADGTSIVEQEEQDWFLDPIGFGLCCTHVVIPVYGSTLIGPSLPFSMPDRPVAHYMRRPKALPRAGAILVDTDVTIVAAMLSGSTGFGDPATLREVVNKWRGLDREYAYWLTVIADAWHDDSAIATLRTVAPLVPRPRRGALGETVRLQIKKAIDDNLGVAETNLGLAPWLLEAMIRSIEQQRGFLRTQLEQ
jgi:hypothetical protein